LNFFFQTKSFKYGENLDDIELWEPHIELIEEKDDSGLVRKLRPAFLGKSELELNIISKNEMGYRHNSEKY
jgi:hypothetical protein